MRHFLRNELFYHPLFWILVYLGIHFSIRILFSQTLQVDDAEQVRHAQELLLGYPIPQPPLYSWLSWGLFQLIGTGLLALTLLKYILIGLTFWLTWVVSGYLFIHTQTRWLATTAYLLTPSFAWHMHQGFTHTILLGFTIIITLHALLRFYDNSSNLNILYLGTAIATGLVSKYSYLLFIIPLLLSALTISTFRNRLFTWKGILIFFPLIVIALPHLLWLADHHQEVFSAISHKLKVTHDNLFIERISSLSQFTVAATAFVVPLLPIYLLVTGKRLFLNQQTLEPQFNQQLLNRFYLLLIGIILLLALFVSMPHFKVRWFHPLMMIFPLWMLGRIERQAPLTTVQIRWIGGTTILITGLIIVIRLLQNIVGPELGHYSRLNRPIIESLEQLPSQLQSDTVFVTSDHFITAHLLLHYRGAPIRYNETTFNAEGIQNSNQCLYLWDNDSEPTSPPIATLGIDGVIEKHREGITYRLSYALLQKEHCSVFMR